MADDADRNRLPTPSCSIFVIGNPENRRVAFFREAAGRLALPAPQVVSYEDLLAGPAIDPALDSIGSGSLVRIESPGENSSVEAALIRRGASLDDRTPAQADRCSAAAAEHGRIAFPRLWFLGYRDLLGQIDQRLTPRDVRWMNHPAEIAVLFDKPACRERLAERGIPTPLPLSRAADPPVESYDDLAARMDAAEMRRAFVKLRYGSSASGVIALARGASRMRATTSVELVREAGETKLFNSLRLREYRGERDIAAIIDELCRHEIHVDEWLPKANLNGRVFDLRVMVIDGQVRHVVVRTSRGPITNLHLGNARGDLDALLQRWPAPARESAWQSCRAVAAAFPRSRYFGVDLLLTPSLKRHAILEVNAFGDLLPGILDAGDDTYTAELRGI
jgi:glutathione synthase/RimK-type ligase-like ATP-grasp enzyme